MPERDLPGRSPSLRNAGQKVLKVSEIKLHGCGLFLFVLTAPLVPGETP